MAKVQHHLAKRKTKEEEEKEFFVVPGETLESYKARLLEMKSIDIDRYDFEAFLAEFNLWHGKRQTPKFHREMCRWLDRTDSAIRRQLQAYRHRGKTYIAGLLLLFWLFKDPNTSIVVVRATRDAASKRSSFIKRLIEAWPLVQHLYPGTKADNWQKQDFSVLSPMIGLHTSVQCTSLQSDFTGVHADRLLGDDIETSETAKKQEKLREKIKEFAAVSPNHLYIGTPHAEDRVYEYLKKQNNQWECNYWPVWRDEARRKTQMDLDPEILIDGKIRQDAAWADLQKSEYGVQGFAAQYCLIPSNAWDTRLDRNLLQEFSENIEIKKFIPIQGDPRSNRVTYRIGGKQLTQLVAYFDPSSAASKSHDDSVLRIVGYCDVDQSVYLFEREAMPAVSMENGTNYDKMCDKVIDLLQTYHLDRIHVEVNFNPLIANAIREAAKRKQRRLIVVESSRSKAQTQGQGKNGFIARYVETLLLKQKLFIQSRTYRLRDFVKQLSEFPNCQHDDHLDAFASCCHELNVKHIHADAAPDPQALYVPVQGGKLNTYQPFKKRISYA
ncbi:MAG TPA: phage terminase large subunit [Dongiaceae bacterium]|nr:phage terminase large subunit [Dongiaceae bacterium]